MKRVALLILAMGLLAIGCRRAWAPEHPSEHPTAPVQPTIASLTNESLARAIENYIKMDSKLKGGYFLVYDTVAKMPLVLTLDRVHKDKLARVQEGCYFACADFETADGVMYDLDFFMEGKSVEDLHVVEISIHKQSGVERYTWYEEGGVWHRRPQPGAEGHEEHPSGGEHPSEHPQ